MTRARKVLIDPTRAGTYHLGFILLAEALIGWKKLRP